MPILLKYDALRKYLLFFFFLFFFFLEIILTQVSIRNELGLLPDFLIEVQTFCGSGMPQCIN